MAGEVESPTEARITWQSLHEATLQLLLRLLSFYHLFLIFVGWALYPLKQTLYKSTELKQFQLVLSRIKLEGKTDT